MCTCATFSHTPERKKVLTAKQLYKFLGDGRQFTEVSPTQNILFPKTNMEPFKKKNTSQTHSLCVKTLVVNINIAAKWMLVKPKDATIATDP